MPISQTHQVFSLIKSLSPAEKRNFRVYARRLQTKADLQFLHLFDILDKQKELNEKAAIKQLGGLEMSRWHNTKRHLYSQIITSLRLLHKEKRANFKVRELLDFAYILYGKGLYLQALKILRKGKSIAKKHHLVYMQLIIIEFEKTIETRHITRSGSNMAVSLIKESNLIQQDANDLVNLSNLRISMHAKYLQQGHVKNQKEAQKIKDFYQREINHIDIAKLGVIESINYIQSQVWYHFILMDFHSCMTYAIQWVQLMKDNPTLIERDVDLYLRGNHYILTTAYHIRNIAIHSEWLEKLEKFRKTNYKTFNTNSQILSFLYVHTGRLDSIIMEGKFTGCEIVIKKVQNRLRKYQYKIDDHRVMVFYFKFAWIYLGAGNASMALQYLNKIANNELKKLREDLQNYARILQLICHYELHNFDILEYILHNSTHHFTRKKATNPFITFFLDLFHRLNKKGIMDHKEEFRSSLTEFYRLSEDIYESKALMYIDVISWIESKISGKPLSYIIQSKAGSTEDNPLP